ncbi:MAG: hypothetical protein J0L97_03180 [Alphaproteobacteria bacterium]|nr:hypothetical protein [Alphaproteobacteria bacterium]
MTFPKLPDRLKELRGRVVEHGENKTRRSLHRRYAWIIFAVLMALFSVPVGLKSMFCTPVSVELLSVEKYTAHRGSSAGSWYPVLSDRSGGLKIRYAFKDRNGNRHEGEDKVLTNYPDHVQGCYFSLHPQWNWLTRKGLN